MLKEQVHTGNCVYILKSGECHYKIGKTQDLQQRLSSYHTHLPGIFSVIRQYFAYNMDALEEALHIVFQHKRVQGEWFELSTGDLIICDNIARGYAFTKLHRQAKKYKEIQYAGNPLLQVMEASEKYLTNYSKIVEDIGLGLTNGEILELYEGTVSKLEVETVRRLLKQHTPNSEFISQWIFVVTELESGLTEDEIIGKYEGKVNRTTIHMIKRILHNQLY